MSACRCREGSTGPRRNALDQLAKDAGKEVEAALVDAKGRLTAALEALRPLTKSPLLWNGANTAVQNLYDELDALEDRVPEIQRIVREHFGARTEEAA